MLPISLSERFRRMSFHRRHRSDSGVISIERLEERTLLSTFIVMNLAEAGSGSLRDAVTQANGKPGADLVKFDNEITGTIALTTGPVTITDDLRIAGPGAADVAVSGSNLTRVFCVDDGDATANRSVEISGLTIRDGKAAVTGGVGGGVFNTEDLTLRDMVFRHNQALGDLIAPVFVPPGAPAAGGGAVYNAPHGSLFVRGSNFAHNISDGPGAFFSIGGAILNQGVAEITSSTFDNNRVFSADNVIAGPAGGGAIANVSLLGSSAGAELSVHGSRFDQNQVSGGDSLIFPPGGLPGGGGTGGAIFLGIGAVAEVHDSSFTENLAVAGLQSLAGGAGGAIFGLFDSTLTVQGSRFVGNRCVGAPSDGIGNFGGGGGISMLLGTTTIVGSTFSGNEAVAATGGNAFGGGVHNEMGTLTVTTSQFINNRVRGGDKATAPSRGFGMGGAVLAVAGTGAFGTLDSFTTIDRSSFIGNEAVGGAGPAGGTGGPGIGGAVSNHIEEAFVSGQPAVAHITITASAFFDNRAIGGDAGDGESAGLAQGGALANWSALLGPNPLLTAELSMSDSLVSGNQAIGGAGAVGGNAFGGGIYNEDPGVLRLSGLLVLGNEAMGGSGEVGGNGYGGGIFVGAGADVSITRSLVLLNKAVGGDGASMDGEGVGGGLYVEDEGGTSVELIDSLFTLNFDDSGISNILFGPIVSND